MKIMYLRKSRADNPYETVEEVLARHEKLLQDYAVQAFGQPIPEKDIYREIVSGEKIENRPEMQIVLRRMESEDVDGVLVVDPQRLSRGDLKDCGTLMEVIKYSHTLIHTPVKTYNLWDKFDERTFRDELLRGREYLEYAKEVMARGRKMSTAEGWYPGSTPPFGYEFDHVYVGKKRRQTLKPHPTEADAVRSMFDWFVNFDMTMYGIALKLDALGFKPRRSEHFTTDGVRNILANPVYIGKIAVGRRNKKEYMAEGQVVVSRPRTEPEQIFEGQHPAIVSEELFQLAQERVGTLPKLKAKTQLRNPLAGLLKCSCGYTLVYHKDNKGTPRLNCSHKPYCKSRSVSFDLLYDAVVEKLKECTADFEVKVDSGINVAAEKYNAEMDRVKSALRELDAQQERIFGFLESGTYDEETFRIRNRAIVEKRAAMTAEYEKLAANAPPDINYNDLIGTLHEAIDAMKADYLSPQQKNDFLKEVVERIVYTSLPPIDDGTHWGKAQFSVDIFLRDI